MVKRFGNVVFWLALLVLGVTVLNTIAAANSSEARNWAMASAGIAAIIAAVRYILRGRL